MEEKNKEYQEYVKELKSKNFDKKLKKLKKMYGDKKVLIYGNGIFFDAVADNYDLKSYLNIIGVSDLRYEKHPVEVYKSFKTYKPNEISDLDVDVILVATVMPKQILAFLKRFQLINEDLIVATLVQENRMDIMKEQLHKFHNTLRLFLEKPSYAFKYPFFCNSVELNSKTNYLKVLKRIRNYPSDRKLRVVFICEENAKWGCQSIYEAMKKDEKFEVLPIVCLPIITKNRVEMTQKDNIEFFKNFGMEAIDGYNEETEEYIDLKMLNPDIVFYQQHWYCISTMPPSQVSEYALTSVVSYGFTSISANVWSMSVPRRFCGNLWKMFAESKYHKGFYEEATRLANKDILITTGYPKLDFYNQPVKDEFEKIWKDEGKKDSYRIIWAPHHSIDRYSFGMSNFKQHAHFFLDFAKKHPQYHFLVKPHPALRIKCISEKFMSAQEYDDYLNEWQTLENGCVYDKGNYFDIFKTSDLLITDSSSFLAEYFVSGKPIVFFESETRMPFNKFGLKLKKGFYQPRSVDELEEMLHSILEEKNDYLKPIRETIKKEEIYIPQEGVGQKIVNYIKSELV